MTQNYMWGEESQSSCRLASNTCSHLTPWPPYLRCASYLVVKCDTLLFDNVVIGAFFSCEVSALLLLLPLVGEETFCAQI